MILDSRIENAFSEKNIILSHNPRHNIMKSKHVQMKIRWQHRRETLFYKISPNFDSYKVKLEQSILSFELFSS